MKIRGPDVGERIGDIEVVKETKYLGIQIGGRERNIFESENKKLIEKARKKANALLAQIKKSADKIIVGKAIWKLMAIPAILYGRAVIPTSKYHIELLQRIENKVWRYLLGIGGYATVEALRGEIGTSMVKSRVMENMMLYMVDTLASDFTNVKRMMMDTIDKEKGRWYKAIEEYRIELKITWEELKKMERPALKNLIKQYDTAKWEEGMIKKTSMKYYIKEKKEIKYELCYRNNNSMFYARARTNSIKLEDHKGRGIENYNKTCKLCNEEKEDLVHFLTKCRKLEEKRNYNLLDRKETDPENRMRKLLFRNNECYEIGKMIKELWILRRNLLKLKLDKKGKQIDKEESIQKIYCKSDPGPQKRTLRIGRLKSG